jgi:hypothetical protein
MSEYDGTILFKQWLPDLPELNNPGLTEALNVRPMDGTYKDFRPLSATGNALPSRPYGAFQAFANGAASIYTLALSTDGAQQRVYVKNPTAAEWTTRASSVASVPGGYRSASFAQFDDLVVIAGSATDVPLKHTVGSASSVNALFASGSTLPSAGQIGVVNRFVVIGDVDVNRAYVRWSAIDDPTNWPLPGSATAIATQAGEQFLDDVYGEVTGIASGDQFGLVFQRSAVTRLTYVGGNTVFQIDKVDRSRGAYYPGSIIKAGALIYFMSEYGFHVTDGVTVQNIGEGQVDGYLRSLVATSDLPYSAQVCGAHDYVNGLLYWAVPTSTSIDYRPNVLFIYNIAERRWSRASQDCLSLFQSPAAWYGLGLEALSANVALWAFNSSYRISRFAGAPGTAVMTTGELEPNPSGYAEELGIKPLVDVTANAITVAMGRRSTLQDAVSYTSEVTANSRSGFANFRGSARYHRARLTITGTFNAAQGVHYQAEAAGFT